MKDRIQSYSSPSERFGLLRNGIEWQKKGCSHLLTGREARRYGVEEGLLLLLLLFLHLISEGVGQGMTDGRDPIFLA